MFNVKQLKKELQEYTDSLFEKLDETNEILGDIRDYLGAAYQLKAAQMEREHGLTYELIEEEKRVERKLDDF